MNAIVRLIEIVLTVACSLLISILRLLPTFLLRAVYLVLSSLLTAAGNTLVTIHVINLVASVIVDPIVSTTTVSVANSILIVRITIVITGWLVRVVLASLPRTHRIVVP
jgi:hypothetical protein